MIIYIFRHAQKAMDFSSDPDLTAKGHEQAKKIAQRVQQGRLPRPTLLWTSPRLRAQSTLRPLAKELGVSLKITPALLEQSPEENTQAFRNRVKGFFDELPPSSKEVLFLCSHYDWVAEAMTVVPADNDLYTNEFSHWTPAQHVGFEIQEDGVYKYLEVQRMD